MGAGTFSPSFTFASRSHYIPIVDMTVRCFSICNFVFRSHRRRSVWIVVREWHDFSKISNLHMAFRNSPFYILHFPFPRVGGWGWQTFALKPLVRTHTTPCKGYVCSTNGFRRSRQKVLFHIPNHSVYSHHGIPYFWWFSSLSLRWWVYR